MSSNKLFVSKEVPLPLEVVTQRMAVLGSSGAGKTNLGRVLAEEMMEAKQQVVILDPTGAFWGLRSSADGTKPGFPVVVVGGEHADIPLDHLVSGLRHLSRKGHELDLRFFTAGELIANAVVTDRFSAVLDLSDCRRPQQTAFITGFAETFYQKNRRQPVHLLVDEADVAVPQKLKNDGEQRMVSAMDDIVRRGRGRGIGTTLMSHRSALVDKNVLAMAETLWVFRTQLPADKKVVRDWVLTKSTEDSTVDMLDDLSSLATGTAWLWSPFWLKLFSPVKIRLAATFDSGATPQVGFSMKAPKTLAPVDILTLGGKLAELAEQVKESDPEILKAELKQARKQLEDSEIKVGVLNQQLLEAQAKKAKTVTALSDGERRDLEGLATRLENISQEVDALTARTEAMLGEASTIRGFLQERLPLCDKLPLATGEPILQVLQRKVSESLGMSEAMIQGTPPPTSHFALKSQLAQRVKSALPTGEEKVLTACIQFPGGLSRQQLTTLTGFKRSTRDAYIARLRDRGFLVVSGDLVTASAAGLAELPNCQPLPTGVALRDYWRHKLPTGEWQLLETLIAAYPEGVERDRLTEATGFKRSTRDAYLARLRAKELIVDGRDGVCASPSLFELGKF